MNATASAAASSADRTVPAGRPGWTVMFAVAVTYGIGRLAAAAVTATMTGSVAAFDPAAEIAGAVVVGATLVWLTTHVGGTSLRRTATLGLLLFASVAAVMIEGTAYAPSLSPLDRLPSGLALQLGVSLLTAWVAVISGSRRAASRVPPRRRAIAAAASLLAAALVYVATYFVTGAVNFALVTGPYYAAHAGGLTTPPPPIVLAVAVGEGLLLTVGSIPFAAAVTGSPRGRAITCGIALWVLGGVVPLLQAASLPDVLRAASAVEIFFQKVPLGIAVVWLFGSRREAVSSEQ